MSSSPPPVQTIIELFARDPLLLSDSDIDQIIQYEREYRAEYQATGRPRKDKIDIEAAATALKELGILAP